MKASFASASKLRTGPLHDARCGGQEDTQVWCPRGHRRSPAPEFTDTVQAMNNKLALAASGILIALVSAALGVAVSIFYLAQPLQKGQGEFSEGFLVTQAEALKGLRAGQPAKALAYLELVSSISLRTLGEQKDAGARVPSNSHSAQAVQELCSQPATQASGQETAKITFAEACMLLQKP
jgi:preprotein translocase subunit SecF